MTVHRITCESIEQHVARSLIERVDLPESLDLFVLQARDEWRAERELVEGYAPEPPDDVDAAKRMADLGWEGWTTAEQHYVR